VTRRPLRGEGPSGALPSAARGLRRAPWRHPWVIHLRLGFNLVLSPIYLWGVWLAGGGLLDWRTWVGWVSLHVFLYGGTTAFNSVYDEDAGPIGGLRHPPPVDRGLLWWSLAVQAAGLPLAFLVGPAFLVAWFGLALVAAAYSHPLVRLKARPAAALAAVALGQGGIGFLAGWWAVAEPGRGLAALADVAEPIVLLGATTASLVLVGLYVVTQAYQTVEDRERGDRTLAVVWGPRRALLRGLVASAVGVALMIAVVIDRLGAGWAVVVAAGAAAVGFTWWRWAVAFDESELDANYRVAMRIAAVGGGGLSAFLLVHLAVR
jgi:4-hydroxybenzoate polyprenyltransferase